MARKILLADDSVTAQNMGRRILSDAGYDVITVNNGSAALKKIAESKPDLIILDVYMPGYGGLEVCQRLKEAQETARIPVLLSVGKLEPFKVEESRRVRADGFIIKPFEASELLTALTKLEDKIVPEAGPSKGGRFAKASAPAEQLAADSQADGENSSWRSRLAIPSSTPKLEEPEKQEPRPASAGLRDIAQREESKSVAMKSAEAAVAAALPQGITPEELAAIAAIANTFAGKSEPSAAKAAEPAVVEPAKAEIPVEEKVELSTPVVAEAVTFAAVSTVPNEVTAEIQIEAQNETRRGIQTPAQAAELQRATTDAEVLAALASLSPTHTEALTVAGESASVTEGNASSGERVAETGASGPRWIAQAVAIADDESTLVLEREMEKAYAAMAALEAERTSAPIVAEVAAASTELISSTPETSASVAAEPSPQIKAEEQAPSPEPVVAVSVPEVSAPEVVAAPETPSIAAENVTTVSETSIAITNESAAYAAAASAGSGVSESSTSAESSSIAAPAEVEPGRESELAAAWQNWKQIRESIMGSSSATPAAQTATPKMESPAFSEIPAQGFNEIQPEAAAAAKPEAETASEGIGEASEISSIVDTMLAELKPKLMEEISKKMGKSKRKK